MLARRSAEQARGGVRVTDTVTLVVNAPIVRNGYEPSRLRHSSRRPYHDGTADVTLGPRSAPENSGGQVRSGTFILEAIRDAREVDRLIRATFDP